MDIITIHDLAVETVIGIDAWERRVKQTVYLELAMAVDVHAAAASDDIKDTINYHSIAQHITEFIETHHYQLIETLAEHCAAHIQQCFHIPWLKLSLHKPGALPNSRHVSICIERGKKT